MKLDLYVKVEECLRTRTTEELFEAYDKGTFRFVDIFFRKCFSMFNFKMLNAILN